ncbi:hypothetical protein [Chondromyces crocatus]|uniref:hypothetical protein n=1 Tax=Chondromyces crocatus TaxID=52 RepID=UPI00067AF9B1|nr:hypothetical protein [Chondromyces crocatus]
MVRLIIDGDLAASEVVRILDQYRLSADRYGYVLVMADVTRIGTMPAEARKSICAGADIPMRGTVIYNTSFQSRLLCTLVMGALQLFTGAQQHPVVFLVDEAEARAWIDERRLSLGDTALAV